MRKILITLLLVSLTFPCYAMPKHTYYEKDYQEAWAKANNASLEVILPDKARVDCVTKTHAIEFDFAQKWGESIGQSLYYAIALHKKAGIVLIMENPEKDQKYLNRVLAVAKEHDITVWTIIPDFVTKTRQNSLGK